jgi:anti-sigma regulatory factor (Ser/Thr protein kinase)
MTAPPDNVDLLLTLSADERFLMTARAVTERVAFHVGRPEHETHEIAAAVESVVACIVAHAGTRGGPPEIAIRFNASAERLEIEIACDIEPDGGLEEALRSHQGGLDALSRPGDRVEFGRDGGREFCRLTRNFPDFT